MNERKVLVVDDDQGMREVLESILVLEHTLVYTAVDGKDAVQKTLALMPDLILLDFNMPKLNGLTFCKAIRAGKETRNIPVIIITSLTAAGRLEGVEDPAEQPATLLQEAAVVERAAAAEVRSRNLDRETGRLQHSERREPLRRGEALRESVGEQDNPPIRASERRSASSRSSRGPRR